MARRKNRPRPRKSWRDRVMIAVVIADLLAALLQIIASLKDMIDWDLLYGFVIEAIHALRDLVPFY